MNFRGAAEDNWRSRYPHGNVGWFGVFDGSLDLKSVSDETDTPRDARQNEMAKIAL
jgi:hypothetical protein